MHPILRSLSTLRDVWFPPQCPGCSRVLLHGEGPVCLHCQICVPLTRFAGWEDNPVERVFWGRLPLEAATSWSYLKPGAALHQLIHALKYKHARGVGEWLGRELGASMLAGGRFAPEVLVPVPIHPKKRRVRGYNQAAVIAEGMAQVLGCVVQEVAHKPAQGPSQTGLDRAARWQNVAGRFAVGSSDVLAGKRVVLVDDVLTTGATLEALGRTLAGLNPTSLGVATVAYTHR